MDQFMVDVTDIPDVTQGDDVTLVGRDGDGYLIMSLSAMSENVFRVCITAMVKR